MADPVPIYPTSGGGSSGSGGSGGGTVEITMREYVDAQDERTRAQNDARFAEVVAEIAKVGNLVTTQGELMKIRLDAVDGDLRAARAAAERAEAAAGRIIWNYVFLGLTVVALAYGGFALWNQAVEMTTGILSAPAN